jgi:hypothetical protein
MLQDVKYHGGDDDDVLCLFRNTAVRKIETLQCLTTTCYLHIQSVFSFL